jgi:hypothetical protein
MGVRSEKSAGVAMKASLERFSFEGLGLQFYFSFQTPIRASEFRSERQFDLFVRMKWNVDAVQSIGDERLVAGSC